MFSGKYSCVHICAYVRRSIFSEYHRIICICISFIHFVRITGKRLAREGMPLEGLQQMQGAVGLLLHKHLSLMDHLYLLPVFPHTCLENEDGQQKEPYLKQSFHLIEKIGFGGEVTESWAEFTSPK